MKTTKTFENATLRTVNNGYIELDYNGKTQCFHNASVISINNGNITIEVDWEPKEGELVKITGNHIDAYSIFQAHDKPNGIIIVYGHKRINDDDHSFCQHYWFEGNQTEIHPVTPEEQQAFDDFCKSTGKIWNKEKLQWEKYKWSPKPNECYWHVTSWGEVMYKHYLATSVDQGLLQVGNAFPTKEEAQKVAEKVKELFKSL